jgi:predicted deacylase
MGEVYPMSTFQIGNVRAEPGTKVTGYIDVSETAVTTMQMPVVIINGAKPGPKVCFTGGVHGGEYSSIEAVIRIANMIDPADLSGVLYTVPVVNISAFEARGPQGGLSSAFHNRLDSLNLNRLFPGHPDGTATHRLAYVLLNEVIAKADYYADFHGGDLNEELMDYVIVAQCGDAKVDQAGIEILAKSFDCELISTTTGTTGSCGAAAQLGIPAIVAEAGGYGRLMEEKVQWHLNGMQNILKHLKMLPGESTPTPAQRIRSKYVMGAKHGGLFYGKELYARVSKGDTIAEIKNLFGEVVDTIKSPADGIIAFRRAILPCSTGDRLISVFPDVEPETPPPAPPYP